MTTLHSTMDRRMPAFEAEASTGKETSMLLMITAIVVLEAWGLGFALNVTFGGILHALLPVAGALVIVQLILGGRRVGPQAGDFGTSRRGDALPSNAP